MKVEFWGTRGSIATPSNNELCTLKYGGNTPCICLTLSDGTIIIIDMGTGARLLGDKLMGMAPGGKVLNKTTFNQGEGEANIFISHFHWDHIQGLPFFKPIYIEGNKLNFFAGGNCEANLKYQMSKPFFPVELDQTMSVKRYYDFKDGEELKVGTALVTAWKLDHTDDVYGYRVNDNGKIFTYASDVEHNLHNEKNLRKLSKDSDVLVYDCQYTYMEYDPAEHGVKGLGKKQWGHSIIQEGIKISAEMGVKRLVSFHHGPDSADEKISDITEFAQEYKKDFNKDLEVIAAYEGLEIEL